MSASRVLLVVDADLPRQLLADLLEDAGYTALQATNGLDAFDLLGIHGGCDAIVLDLELRTRDARLFRAQQMKREALKKIPVVVAGSTDEAFGLGADAVVEKPFEPDAVLQALEQVLR